jgi:drug/metabolite transporter (DMT)-like permease
MFFAVGAIFALIGMVWGVQMSVTHDHTLSPAHGHLNLIGFVAMSVFGAYYALTPAAAASRIGGVHFALTVVTVLVLTPGIAMAITEQGEGLAQIGSLLAILTMAVFVYAVLRHGVGSAGVTHPAE